MLSKSTIWDKSESTARVHVPRPLSETLSQPSESTIRVHYPSPLITSTIEVRSPGSVIRTGICYLCPCVAAIIIESCFERCSVETRWPPGRVCPRTAAPSRNFYRRRWDLRPRTDVPSRCGRVGKGDAGLSMSGKVLSLQVREHTDRPSAPAAAAFRGIAPAPGQPVRVPAGLAGGAPARPPQVGGSAARA